MCAGTLRRCCELAAQSPSCRSQDVQLCHGGRGRRHHADHGAGPPRPAGSVHVELHVHHVLLRNRRYQSRPERAARGLVRTRRRGTRPACPLLRTSRSSRASALRRRPRLRWPRWSPAFSPKPRGWWRTPTIAIASCFPLEDADHAANLTGRQVSARSIERPTSPDKAPVTRWCPRTGGGTTDGLRAHTTSTRSPLRRVDPLSLCHGTSARGGHRRNAGRRAPQSRSDQYTSSLTWTTILLGAVERARLRREDALERTALHLHEARGTARSCGRRGRSVPNMPSALNLWILFNSAKIVLRVTPFTPPLP